MTDAPNAKPNAEDAARRQIVDLAKKHHMYFVVWDGHFGRWLVGVKDHSKKLGQVYCAMYESYYNLIEDDEEVFKISIPPSIRWVDALPMLQAQFAAERKVGK